MVHILIADDNKQIISILNEYAQQEGYVTFLAEDGEIALEIFEKERIDVVLLDVMMPKKDGFEVCRTIRKNSNIPILMITARGEDFEKIMGLDTGADDYIVKPFSPSEVMARIRAVLRRVDGKSERGDNESFYKYDNLEINLDSYEVSIHKHKISLTKKEIELLWLLVTNTDKVFTRDNLLDSIWGYDYYGDTRTVDSHIKRLRAKLDNVSHYNWRITTVWGVGYKFEGLKDEV